LKNSVVRVNDAAHAIVLIGSHTIHLLSLG
jgi:hypothetical protein